MRALTSWTGGLVGERDPAQPLLTLVTDTARVELSGTTTANWVAKSANLLVDGLGGPERVGVLVPLHWQTLVLVLAGVTTGATVVVAREPAELAGCDAAFVVVDAAEAVLDTGVDDVFAVSTDPLGAPLRGLPGGLGDHAREVLGHGDSWSGPPPRRVDVSVDGAPLGELPALGLSAADRVLTDVSPADPGGLSALLAVLRESAALVLVGEPRPGDLARAAAQEQVTATAGGVGVAGARALLPGP